MARRKSSKKKVQALVLGLVLSISLLILLILVFLKDKGSLLPVSEKVIRTVDEQLLLSGVDTDHSLTLIHKISYEKDRPYNYCARRVVFTNDMARLHIDISNSLADIQSPYRPGIIGIRTSILDNGILVTFRLGSGNTTFYLLELFRPLETENGLKFSFPFFGKPQGKIAIIIDDVGGNLGQTAQKFFSFPEKITFAVMPFLEYSTKTAELLHSIDRFQVILHQPMQPEHPGKRLPPGEIMTNMTEKEIHQTLTANFSSVRYAVGMNNHEGSLATSNPATMTAIIKYLKNRDLFYIDSYTTRNSVGFKIAKKMNVAYNKRSVFLDNEENEDYIKRQLDLLVKTALDKGSAIGIGHITKPLTIKVLLENVDSIKDRGIEFVTASELLKR